MIAVVVAATAFGFVLGLFCGLRVAASVLKPVGRVCGPWFETPAGHVAVLFDETLIEPKSGATVMVFKRDQVTR